jgi:nucleotide-binding universal stress UspA family protein
MVRVELVGRILVPVDGSPHARKALEHAMTQAKMSRSSITIMYVVHTRVYAAAQEAGFVAIAPLMRNMEELGKRVLQEAQAVGQAAGIDTNTFLVHGIPADEIVKKAETERYDMIVIGSRGRTAAKSFLLGSVSNRVSHYAKCPVLIVK